MSVSSLDEGIKRKKRGKKEKAGELVCEVPTRSLLSCMETLGIPTTVIGALRVGLCCGWWLVCWGAGWPFGWC